MVHVLPRRRTERMVVALRGLVTALVLLHVILVWSALEQAGLLAAAIAACAVLVASTAASAVGGLAAARHGARRLLLVAVAVLDALALVTIARITVEVDPLATLAWAFVLWVPFSLALRLRPLPALAAGALVALLVLAATLTQPGPLQQIPVTWTSVGVPMLLVLVAAVTSVLAMAGHRHSGMQVERQLVHERNRTMRLREADELKNTFLAAVSHDVRTPLTSILGFALTLLDHPELDEAQRERMLRTIVVEAEHLEDILANLLDLDRLTRGKAALVPVELDPARLVRASVQHARRRSGRDVGLDLEEGLRVRLDPAKVERIVENLVGNAMKYSPEDAEIRVALDHDEAGVHIRVDDAGPGVPREHRDTIFEPFRRGPDAGVSGTGVGLSLVDRFSRMHGGRAWVEERPGGGARFEVYLPSVGAPVHVVGADGDQAGQGASAPIANVLPAASDGGQPG